MFVFVPISLHLTLIYSYFLFLDCMNSYLPCTVRSVCFDWSRSIFLTAIVVILFAGEACIYMYILMKCWNVYSYSFLFGWTTSLIRLLITQFKYHACTNCTLFISFICRQTKSIELKVYSENPRKVCTLIKR